MVMHTGTSYGYAGHIVMIPDKQIGVYSSITGLDSGYHGRRALHMYIIDLLLGETPWYNLTTACTYPPNTRKQREEPTPGTADLPLSDYEGAYGNYGYGNLTVTKTEDTLEMTYGSIGRWNLHPTAVENQFTGEGVGDVWNMRLSGVQFTSIGGRVEEVSVSTFNSAVFTRGLKMDSAPEPPPVDCTVSSANHVVSMSVLVLFSSLLPNIQTFE